MEFIETPFSGLWIIKHKQIIDERGYFTRTFCQNEFKQIAFKKNIVQINQSYNKERGTIRGLHFQLPPFSEYKLIRCIHGSVFDVAVDLRKSSSTFLQYFSLELNSNNMLSILIPEGFAHGFQTLEDNSILLYHHTEFYTPGYDTGIRYDDPRLKISWPLAPKNLSPRDLSHHFIEENFNGL